MMDHKQSNPDLNDILETDRKTKQETIKIIEEEISQK